MEETKNRDADEPNIGDVVFFNCVLLPIVGSFWTGNIMLILLAVFFAIFTCGFASALVFCFARRLQGRMRVTLISSLAGWLVASVCLSLYAYGWSGSASSVLPAVGGMTLFYGISALGYMELCRSMLKRKAAAQACSTAEKNEHPSET